VLYFKDSRIYVAFEKSKFQGSFLHSCCSGQWKVEKYVDKLCLVSFQCSQQTIGKTAQKQGQCLWLTRFSFLQSKSKPENKKKKRENKKEVEIIFFFPLKVMEKHKGHHLKKENNIA